MKHQKTQYELVIDSVTYSKNLYNDIGSDRIFSNINLAQEKINSIINQMQKNLNGEYASVGFEIMSFIPADNDDDLAEVLNLEKIHCHDVIFNINKLSDFKKETQKKFGEI